MCRSASVRHDEAMTVGGLPLHPLVIHAAVILIPLAGLTAIGYLHPRWRDRLRWPLAALGVLSVVLALVAVTSGRDLLDERFQGVTGALSDQLEEHEELGVRLRNATFVFAALAVATAWWHPRRGGVQHLLAVLTALAGGVVLVLAILAGDSGARAVWGG